MLNSALPVAIAGLTLVATLPAQGDVLLIPDSSGDKVWAFDPFDGHLLSANAIPDDGNMVQAINAIDSGRSTILISDENADAVLEYGYDGQFVGAIADATDGLDALFGITVRDGKIYVVSRSAANIVRMDLDGANLEVWADTSLGTPRDILFREADALVSNSGDENIERLGLDGSFLETWHDSDGVTGIDFPQQMQSTGKTVLVAGFTAPFGIYEYDTSGAEINAYTNIITSPRGVYPLGNGRILYAGGTRVMSYDPATGTEDTIINQSGTSFRFIELTSFPTPCFGDITQSGTVEVLDLIAIINAWGTDDPAADLDGSGTVDVTDLIGVINSWGDCP